MSLRGTQAPVIGCLEPVNVKHAALVHFCKAAACKNALAFIRQAAFVAFQALAPTKAFLTGGKQAAVLFAKLVGVNSPLSGAGIKRSYAATGYQNIELSAGNVVADIGGLHNHSFPGEGLGARVITAVIGAACKTQFVTPPANITALGGGETIGEGVVNGPGGLVLAHVAWAVVVAGAFRSDIIQ